MSKQIVKSGAWMRQQHFRKYSYLITFQELDETVDTTPMYSMCINFRAGSGRRLA